MITDLQQHNLEHIRTLFKSVRKPHPLLLSVQAIAKTANTMVEAVKANAPNISQKGEGWLYDDQQSYPNPEMATVDKHSARVGLTHAGYSILMESRFWVTYSVEEAKQIMEKIKAGLTMRYHNEYDQWLDGMIDDDRETLINLFAGIAAQSHDRDSKPLYAVMDNVERISDKTNIALPVKGSVPSTITQVLSHTLTTMQTGDTLRMECRFGINLSCVYDKPVAAAPPIDVSGFRAGFGR